MRFGKSLKGRKRQDVHVYVRVYVWNGTECLRCSRPREKGEAEIAHHERRKKKRVRTRGPIRNFQDEDGTPETLHKTKGLSEERVYEGTSGGSERSPELRHSRNTEERDFKVGNCKIYGELTN